MSSTLKAKLIYYFITSAGSREKWCKGDSGILPIQKAGRLIYVADHRVRNDVRIRLQQKTHEYRQDIYKRLKKAAEAHRKLNAPEIEQLQLLEEYAATVEGALHLES